MGIICHFPECGKRATHYERMLLTPYVPRVGDVGPVEKEVRAFCDSHYGEDECPNHVASATDPKVCGRCGIHIDSLR